MIAVGLMSGTSMDGIDVAMIHTDGERLVKAGPTLFMRYDVSFRRQIEAGLKAAKTIVDRSDRPGHLSALEHAITERHASAVHQLIDGLSASEREIWGKPDVIGFHGQTVLHRPAAGVTVQLGGGAWLAEATGIPVVYDMRANDMRHGGQGAPLIPVYHAALAHGLPDRVPERWPVAFVNIGGISNITVVPEEGDPIAFDCGPGNALIDQWVQREGGVPFDEDGRIASEGGVDRAVLRRYLDKPFFTRKGPKSLDRLDFTLDEIEALDLADGARTLAAVSAHSIYASVNLLPERPRLWIVAGGGRKNPHTLSDLRELVRADDAEVLTSEDFGMAGDFLEAEAWAYLAVRALRGLPLTFPTTTGCSEPVSGGVIVRPGTAR